MTRLLARSLAAVVALLPVAARAQAAVPDSAPATALASASGISARTMAAAATPRPLATGDVVRVLSAAGRYSGTLAQVTADTFTLAAPGRVDAVLRADVTEMHRLVERGSRGRSIAHGAGLGLLAGAVLGFAVGSAAGSGDCDNCAPGKDGTAQAAFTADGAVLGALFGAMLGPTFRRARWERVDAAAVPPPLAPAAQAESPGTAPQR